MTLPTPTWQHEGTRGLILRAALRLQGCNRAGVASSFRNRKLYGFAFAFDQWNFLPRLAGAFRRSGFFILFHGVISRASWKGGCSADATPVRRLGAPLYFILKLAQYVLQDIAELLQFSNSMSVSHRPEQSRTGNKACGSKTQTMRFTK